MHHKADSTNISIVFESLIPIQYMPRNKKLNDER